MALARLLQERDRRILALAVPALGTLAIEPLYVLVDTAIVGHLGAAPLGGLALASTVLGTLTTVCNFLAYGTTARVAFLAGRRDHAAAAQVAAQALWLCLLAGLPMATGVLAGAGTLPRVLGGNGAVLAAAATYLRISAAGIPAVLVALVGHGYLRGLSDTRTPLLVVAVANLLNLVLEVVLVYGLHLGIAGSAWGTVVAQTLAGAWFGVLVGRAVLRAGVPLRPRRREIVRLVVVGRRLLVRTAALLAVLATATSVAARVGPVTLAAQQIAVQVHLFLALALDSLAIPGQAFTGTLLGAGDAGEAVATGRRLVTLGLFAGGAVTVVVLALALPLPHLFTTDPEVARLASAALVGVAVAQLPSSVAFVLDGVLMGASDFAYLQWSMLAGLVVFLPFALAVLHWHALGIAGLWLGLVAWMAARAACNAARFAGRRWTAVPA